MYKKLLLMMVLLFSLQSVFATGEPSTYFQIFVPPNNDAVRRDAALIITAIYDSTSFDIIDDGMDGDTDDSKSGILMAGQSYVLYIRDNGINDDARYASGGVLKWDGDYFIVKSNKLLYASQSTNSDWQHDWVPSTDKKSIGQKFIIYSPPFTSSKRDVNVFAYENNTTITFQKISTKAKTNTGFTDVNLENPVTVFSRTLNIGEDIIYKYTSGRDVMDAGETYMIVSDKPVTVQYGALFGNERDGGGYVPSSNGSSSGQLLYFGVPYQSGGEQEIRMASWDAGNEVILERYGNGTWIEVKRMVLGRMQAGDWVGKSNGNVSYPTVFRVTCTAGKRVSVFEGNWFETGSPGTSDMGTMVSAENGTSSGTKFITYMAPPGNEANVRNPFTGTNFGQQLTHLYIFAKEGASVTVKDAYTNGAKLNRTYTIGAEKYIDCYLTLAEWRSIYNGTGTPVGPERPYLLVECDNPVSVMNTNFNDNWMCYVGSSLGQSFTQESNVSQPVAIPNDTLTVTSTINTGSTVTNPTVQVIVQEGLKVVESKINRVIEGEIDEQLNKTVVTFNDVNNLQPGATYKVETKLAASLGDNNGTLLNGSINVTVETVVTGNVAGQIQQSSSTEVVNVNTSNTSQLIFSRYSDNLVTKDSTDSWTASWVDINKDGYDDLFVTDKRSSKPNQIYINTTTGGFTRGQSLAADSAISMSNTWADIDNDGDEDLLVLNNTRKPNVFYRNNNGSLVRENNTAFTQTISYYHGGAFADYDNDGKVDLFMCNYFPTKYNELFRNNGAAGFVKELANVIPAEANQSVGPTWADYDGDGFMDLFVPNGNGYKNSLFHNEGNGTFSKLQNAVTAEGGQSVGSCWGDVDNDGDLDLYVTNSNATGNFFYRNEGNGNFTKITSGAPVTDKMNSHGCSFADIDNDGDLDLYVSGDKNLKLLYMNNGDGTFTKKTDEIITFSFGNAFGHAWSDFDHDGDLDLFAATHSNQPNGFFINNGNNNSWIAINLVGTTSNKSAIGADLMVLAGGVWRMREVNSQSGFGGQSSLTQHFGLGNAAVIDSVKVKWPGGLVQVLANVPKNQFITITETQSVKVEGSIYFDANNNGIKDNGETLVARAGVQVSPGTAKVYSNNDGYFSFRLNTGNYQFQVLAERGVIPAGSNPIIRNITNIQAPVDTVWIPATAVCSNADMNIVMGGTAIRKGFTNNNFTMIVTNNGRQTAGNTTLKYKVPSSIILGVPNIPYSSADLSAENGVNYKTYNWPLSSLNPFGNTIINFTHGNEASVNIGDTIKMTSWIEGVVNDCTLADNTVAQTYRVVGAIDPNDIQVAPVGYGREGFIMPTQALTYTIRFQNVGNHVASDVMLSDVLPEGLDITTLKVAATSHDNLSVSSNGRTLLFSYEGIYLRDSASDAKGSEGYVTFTVSPVPGIRAGTVLRNKATIQFDGYEPMETNEVVNTIQSKEQEAALIVVKTYPNPASDVVYVSLTHKMGKFTNREVSSIELYDLTGKRILIKSFRNNDELRVDIPALMSGYYLLKINDNEGNHYLHRLLISKPR
jgi:uncharacterized repeat protein (TIGR01451 family)